MSCYLALDAPYDSGRGILRRALTRLTQQGVRLIRAAPPIESTGSEQPQLSLVLACERLAGRFDAPDPIQLDLEPAVTCTVLAGGAQDPVHPRLRQRAEWWRPLRLLAPRLLFWPPTAAARPLWMGIVNITPDSFSDGGRFTDWSRVEPHIAAMVAAGVHIIDIGAESTRPGATAVTPAAEWARLQPVLERLAERYRADPLRPWFSIDTRHAAVAERALAWGADIINDVGGLSDPAMQDLACASDGWWIAMHQLGVPADPGRRLAPDQDPVTAVGDWLQHSLEQWQRAGLEATRIIVDPGIGFGKNSLQSLALLRRLGELRRLGRPLLVGHSRKSLYRHYSQLAPAARDAVTLGSSLALAAAGADILRVHDVPAHTAAWRGWLQLAG